MLIQQCNTNVVAWVNNPINVISQDPLWSHQSTS